MTIGALVLGLTLLAAPGAATGWLVNVEVGGAVSVKTGTNAFGGQGDTVDVGAFNHQCSDEDDVVDVGVANREGDRQCSETDQGCSVEEASGTLILVGSNGIFLPTPSTTPFPTGTGEQDAHCSDDGDTVDVGVANLEGGYNDTWGKDSCDDLSKEFEGGDEEDGVDVGLLNRECWDNDDAADAGVFNCEWRDLDDGVDVGVHNRERVNDSSDTFDLSVFNVEQNDAPDRNGLNVGTFVGGVTCRLPVSPR